MSAPGSAFDVRLEAAFGDDPHDASPTWTNLAADLKSWQISRGRTSPIDPFDPGTITAELWDDDGDYDTLNPSSPYVNDIVEELHVRLTAAPNGTDRRDLAHGFVSIWDITYSGETAIVNLEAPDQMHLIDLWSGPGPNSGSWDEAPIDGRIGDVLDEVGVDASLQDLGASSHRMLAKANSSVVAGEELRLAATHEGPWAAVFATRDNKIRFDSAASVATRTGMTTSQATLSTYAADHATASKPVLRFGRHRSIVRPYATATKPDGTTVTAGTVGASLDYDLGQIVDERHPREVVDASVTMFGQSRHGPRSASVVPLSTGTTADELLTLELRDRVRVKHLTSYGVAVDVEASVEHIRMAGRDDGLISVAVTLSPIDIVDSLNPTNWLIWGTGLWGTNTWGYT